MRWMIKEQIGLERDVRYDDIEHTLPPSLRRDYVPNKYYNAPTLARMEELDQGVAASGSEYHAPQPG